MSAAIFYNIWHYIQATGDTDFLLEPGVEMMMEIARFWSSIAHFNPERGRYEIHGIMGPDEFHEKYPDTDEPGLRNNAYTNVMVAWILDVAGRLLDMLPERRRSICERIDLTDQEIETWKEMSRKMYVPFHADGVISQFEGWEDLEELDWDAYRREYGNIQRLDRILRAEGKEPDRYKLSKQADTVLLFYLFRQDELKQIFERLGYSYTPETLRKTVLLRCPNLARVHPELRSVCRDLLGDRSGNLLGAVHGGIGERRRRRAGWHHGRGHPHGRDGGDAGPGAARLRGRGDSR